MLLCGLAFRRHAFQHQRLGLRKDFRADLLWIRPCKRALAFLRLGIRVVQRQQPRAHLAGDFFFMGVGGKADHQQTVRLQPFILCQRQFEFLQCEAVESRNGDQLFDGPCSTVTAARRARTSLYGYRYLHRLCRYRHRLGMDSGVDLELVVGHLEFLVVRTDAQDHAVAALFTQHHTALEVAGIDRMGEIDCRDDFLRGRIFRILIKLRLGNLDHERRGGKLHLIRLETHLLGQQLLFRQRHYHLRTHRPVGLGRQSERTVILPFPGAGDARLDRDAGGHLLAHTCQWRHRLAELDRQRIGLGVRLIHRCGLRRNHFKHHLKRFGQFVIPMFSGNPARNQCGARCDHNHRATLVAAHPTRQRDAAKPERIADAL